MSLDGNSNIDINKYIPNLIDYESSGIELDPTEKLVFVNEDGQCLTHTLNDGSLEVGFLESKTRRNFVQMFLAYYSRGINLYVEKLKKDLQGKDVEHPLPFIFLKYDGDREILKSVDNPRRYKKCIEILDTKSFVNNNDNDLLTSTVQNFEPVKNMIHLLLYVNKEDTTVHLASFTLNPYQLYSQCRLFVELYDGRNVELTMLEKDTFLAPETKTTFYEHKNKWEPSLME